MQFFFLQIEKVNLKVRKKVNFNRKKNTKICLQNILMRR